MPDINITVAHKVAVSDTQSIVCDNSDYTVHWTLDDEWGAYDTKTMRTIYMDGTFTDKVFSGDMTELPVCTVPGAVQIGLFAGDIRTSRVAILRALPSVRSAAGAPADHTPDVYDQLMDLIKGLGGVAPDEIAKAVADYLAAHPVKETDPTVPEWAKAETKPTYSAAEVGAIAQPDLQAATNAALAQAKASGEFDGAPGEKGADGAPGIYYGTTQPTGDTHPVWIDPNGMPNELDLSLGITGATVGQIAKIAAVDASGVPTAWSPVDMPSGGGGETWELLSDNAIDDDVSYIAMETPPCKRIRAYFEGHQVFSDGSETSTNFTVLNADFDVDGNHDLRPFYLQNNISRFNSDVVSVIDFDVSTPPFALGAMTRISPNGQSVGYAYFPVSNEIAITDVSAITKITMHPKYKFIQGQGTAGRFASGGRLRIYGVRR